MRSFIFFFFLQIILCQAVSQDLSEEKKSIARKAAKQGLHLLTINPKDTVVNEASANPYIKYSGRIIRNIHIENVGFEKSIYDSTKKVKKTVTEIANALHANTKNSVIRNHLFIKPGKPLSPHKLADNERYLRDRDFILDSRIIVTPVQGTDSVDLTVLTRDVLSIGASAGGSFPGRPKISIYDANIGGRGLRGELIALVDKDRAPKFGYSLLCRKNSIFGSLTDLDLGYTQINTGRSFGEETEFAAFVRLNRPLVSPNTRIAGRLEFSRNWSENVYDKPDTVFLSYRYSIFDTWLGYNFGVKQPVTNRNRSFLAFRYFDGKYQDQPDQPEYAQERIYNNAYGYLGEFTFYRQDFYKTRYVFGFGRTEDVPYGISLGITGGYVKQVFRARPYLGFRFSYGQASNKGNFYQLGVQAGGYYLKKELEDIAIRVGAAYATRVLNLKRHKLRNYVSLTHTQIFNREVIDWLNLGRNVIPGFSSSDLQADKRLAARFESVLFTPWDILGFRFALFGIADLAYVSCLTCDNRSKNFWGLSGGLRTRNENLIFGTFELKFTYVPSNVSGDSDFVISFRQNLRIKSTGRFVRAPSLVSYN